MGIRDMINDGTLDVDVTIKFKIINLIDNQTLEQLLADGTFSSVKEYVSYLLRSEGIFGVVEDDYEVLEVKQVP